MNVSYSPWSNINLAQLMELLKHELCAREVRIKWVKHQMKKISTFQSLYEGNPLITGIFPSQRPATRSFNFFFDPRLNKRLSKKPRHRWLEKPSRPLWRHRNMCPIKARIYFSDSEWITYNSMYIVTCNHDLCKLWVSTLFFYVSHTYIHSYLKIKRTVHKYIKMRVNKKCYIFIILI